VKIVKLVLWEGDIMGECIEVCELNVTSFLSSSSMRRCLKGLIVVPML
jgi:hypothetical protein